jgi:hypothetical protein
MVLDTQTIAFFMLLMLYTESFGYTTSTYIWIRPLRIHDSSEGYPETPSSRTLTHPRTEIEVRQLSWLDFLAGPCFVRMRGAMRGRKEDLARAPAWSVRKCNFGPY